MHFRWLVLKPVLVSKNRKVGNTAKTKRKWKKYWGEYIEGVEFFPAITFFFRTATLKGLHLLLHQCDDESSLREDAHIDYKLGELSKRKRTLQYVNGGIFCRS